MIPGFAEGWLCQNTESFAAICASLHMENTPWACIRVFPCKCWGVASAWCSYLAAGFSWLAEGRNTIVPDSGTARSSTVKPS